MDKIKATAGEPTAALDRKRTRAISDFSSYAYFYAGAFSAYALRSYAAYVYDHMAYVVLLTLLNIQIFAQVFPAASL